MEILYAENVNRGIRECRSETHRLQQLTDEELEQAAGCLAPLAIIGGALGGISYSFRNDNWTPGGFAVAVGTGALGGGFAAWGSKVGSRSYEAFSAATGGMIGWSGGQAAMM